MNSPKGRRIPSREELLELIRDINNLRNQALVSFLYLTGARITEALYITKNDVTEQGGFVLVRLPTLKKFKVIDKIILPNGHRKFITTKEFELRTVPINSTRDKEFLDYFLSWLMTVGMDEPIFGFKSRVRAWQILHKYDLFPHYLRHIRLTHLVVLRRFTDQDLIKFTGWTDSKPAKFYIHLRWEDIAEKV